MESSQSEKFVVKVQETTWQGVVHPTLTLETFETEQAATKAVQDHINGGFALLPVEGEPMKATGVTKEGDKPGSTYVFTIEKQ